MEYHSIPRRWYFVLGVLILLLLGGIFVLLLIRTSDLIKYEDRVPATKEEYRAILGRSSWTLLHTMAAKYPLEDPSEEIKQKTATFIQLFAEMYPCHDCSQDFQGILKEYPPVLDSKHSFIQWSCDVHNIVNRKLNKSEFPCDQFEARWPCGCIYNT